MTIHLGENIMRYLWGVMTGICLLLGITGCDNNQNNRNYSGRAAGYRVSRKQIVCPICNGNRFSNCPKCNALPGTMGQTKCSLCNGSGWYNGWDCICIGGVEDCSNCKFGPFDCNTCKGYGVIYR